MHTPPNRLPRRQTSHDEWLQTSVKLQQVLLDWPRLLGKHDRDAVADGISELGRARDQLLLVRIIFERRLGERAYEDLEELGIDELRRALRRGRHEGSPFRSVVAPQRISAVRLSPREAPACFYWRGVSTPPLVFASSISVMATRMSALSLRLAASSSACFSLTSKGLI